jgi:hypothetical protein
MGYYLPYIVASGALAAVGCGLISTFQPNTSVGRWIGYQILLGAARGIGMQMVSWYSNGYPFASGRSITDPTPTASPCRPEQSPACPNIERHGNAHVYPNFWGIRVS